MREGVGMGMGDAFHDLFQKKVRFRQCQYRINPHPCVAKIPVSFPEPRYIEISCIITQHPPSFLGLLVHNVLC